MPEPEEFAEVFLRLRAILEPYAASLTVRHDTPGHYYLDGPYSEKWGKQLFFASAQIRKNYVSFYLMPVYMYPDLLEDISPELRKRMQGKSCFNFRKPEPALFRELEELIRQSVERVRRDNPS
ncbi:MAG TPA: DUF1801 domain-containing protein [Anaerolineales bacterium]